VDELSRFRKQRAEAGAAVSGTAVFVGALALAVKAHPVLNSSYDAARAEIELHDACHVSVATHTDDGLMVPILRDAGSLDLAGIERELAALTERARQGRLSPSDVQGGTITLTNMGVGSIHAGTPIINPPEVAILGVGSFVRKPVVRGDAVVPGLCCTVDVSFDHRVVDGVEASAFLRRFGDILEAPAEHLS